MPGLFTHLVFVDRLASDPDLSPSMSSGDRALLGTQEGALGALGPDPFCLLLREYPFGEALRLYLQVEERLEDIRAVFTKIKELRDVPNPVDIYTEDVQAEIAGLLGAAQGAIAVGIFDQVLKQVDIFELMKPIAHSGRAPGEWWWSEILHNKRTGRFVSALKARASNDERQAFLYGYLSHFALDAIGHPWVNLLSGGPYRNHWRRHVLSEKWLDVVSVDQVYGQELAGSQLHHRVDVADSSPSDICVYLAEALADTYSGLRWLPGPSEVDECFRLTFKFLRSQAGGGMLALPPLEPFDWFKLDDKLRRLIEWAPPPLGSPPSGSNSPPQDWLKFLDDLLKFAKYCLEKALRLVLLPLDVIGELPLDAVRFFIWNLTRLVMEAYEKLRLGLALSAHVHPWRSQLGFQSELVAESAASRFRALKGPYERFFASGQTYHLVHPALAGSPIEPPLAESIGPPLWKNFMMVMFGNGYANWERAGVLLRDPIRSPVDDRFVSAVSAADAFDAAFRFIDTGQSLANVNLDGDRAFAWPEWEPKHPEPWDVASFDFLP